MTLFDGEVEIEVSMFVARSVAGAVGEVEYFLSFGQRNDQPMVAPLAFVAEPDALLLFSASFDDRAVSFDGGLIEERIALLFPDALARLVDGLHDHQN